MSNNTLVVDAITWAHRVFHTERAYLGGNGEKLKDPRCKPASVPLWLHDSLFKMFAGFFFFYSLSFQCRPITVTGFLAARRGKGGRAERSWWCWGMSRRLLPYSGNCGNDSQRRQFTSCQPVRKQQIFTVCKSCFQLALINHVTDSKCRKPSTLPAALGKIKFTGEMGFFLRVNISAW